MCFLLLFIKQIELEECDKVDKATKVAIEDGCGDTEVWYHVNKRLLPVKCVYFTFISGIPFRTGVIEAERTEILPWATVFCFRSKTLHYLQCR